jgi:hypothetical protein
MPHACHGWAETVAAYRFRDNPAVGGPERLSGHNAATLERSRSPAVALRVPDTSFLNYGTLQPQVGRGSVKERSGEEYLLPPTVVFTPEGVKLGVLGAKLWQRPEEPVAPERARKPIEEQESSRWVEGYRWACAVPQAWAGTVVVRVAACAGDLQEWFLAAMSRSGEARAEFLLRATCNRRLAPGAAPGSLWEEVRAARPLGKLTFKLTRQADRPARRVTLRGQALPGTC